jgi:4-hydroxy-tetrahydrodipicolinate synthase
VIVPIVTPFTEDGRIDREGVRRIVANQVDSGVHGIFIIGTMGEGLSMPIEERIAMVSATADAIAGRLPLYVSISGNCLRDSLEAAKRFLDAAAGRIAALVAHAPFYFPVSGREIEHYFHLLADAAPGPLMVYNIPQTTKVSVPIDTVRKLSQHPRVMGIKDSDREPSRFVELLAAVGSRENFCVVVGNGLLATEGMKLGASGVVVSGANLEPARWVKWWNAAMEARRGHGSWSQVAHLQAELDVTTASYMHGRQLGSSIAALKGMVAKRGLCRNFVLPPLIAEEPES